MTKPVNFPGRVNERRISALHRIDRQIAAGVKRNDRNEYPLTVGDENRIIREAKTLALAIVPAAQARAIRTKKNRTGTGKLARAV